MRVPSCSGRVVATFAVPSASQALEELLPRPPVTILHGGARGADQLAGRIATSLGYAVEVYEADWRIGKRVGPERNLRMLDSKPELPIFVKCFRVQGNTRAAPWSVRKYSG